MYVVIRKEGYEMLNEISRRAYGKLFTELDGNGVYPLSALQARRWVAAGKPHSTPLYVNDEGKVRYARG